MATIINVTQLEDLELGDYVSNTRHKNQEGRVYGFELMGPEDKEWIYQQSVKITEDQVKKPFVKILCNGGGAVSVPVDSVFHILPIKDFKHPCAKDYFKDS